MRNTPGLRVWLYLVCAAGILAFMFAPRRWPVWSRGPLWTPGVATIGALFDWIRNQLPPGTATVVREYPAGGLWERYLDVVERSTGIPRRALRPEAAFGDLGLT